MSALGNKQVMAQNIKMYMELPKLARRLKKKRPTTPMRWLQHRNSWNQRKMPQRKRLSLKRFRNSKNILALSIRTLLMLIIVKPMNELDMCMLFPISALSVRTSTKSA